MEKHQTRGCLRRLLVCFFTHAVTVPSVCRQCEKQYFSDVASRRLGCSPSRDSTRTVCMILHSASIGPITLTIIAFYVPFLLWRQQPGGDEAPAGDAEGMDEDASATQEEAETTPEAPADPSAGVDGDEAIATEATPTPSPAAASGPGTEEGSAGGAASTEQAAASEGGGEDDGESPATGEMDPRAALAAAAAAASVTPARSRPRLLRRESIQRMTTMPGAVRGGVVRSGVKTYPKVAFLRFLDVSRCSVGCLRWGRVTAEEVCQKILQYTKRREGIQKCRSICIISGRMARLWWGSWRDAEWNMKCTTKRASDV